MGRKSRNRKKELQITRLFYRKNQVPVHREARFRVREGESEGLYTKRPVFVYGKADRGDSYTKSGDFVYGRGKGRLSFQPGEEIVYAGAGDGEIRELGIAAAEGDL